MESIRLEPEGSGMPVIVHWDGPGWYGPVQQGGGSNQAVHEYPIYGYGPDGYSPDGESRIWDERNDLGTPGWWDSPCPDGYREVDTIRTHNARTGYHTRREGDVWIEHDGTHFWGFRKCVRNDDGQLVIVRATKDELLTR